MLNTPVLFIVFNRLDTARIVFERIKEIKPKYLYIAADGPRLDREGEANNCKIVREYLLNTIDWNCEIRTLFHETNLGCKYAVSGAIKWFFQNVDAGIVLEDDCFPTISFFKYCERLLDVYKNDPNVGLISGFNYFGKTNDQNDYEFVTTCGIWGWASWRRVISGYNPDFSVLLDKDINSVNTICVRDACGRSFLKHSLLAAKNEINTWDYQFGEYLIVNNLFTVIPSINQIRNIGFIENSTHTPTTPSWYIDQHYEFQNEIRINRKVKLNRNLSFKIEALYLPEKRNKTSELIRIIKRFMKRVFISKKHSVLI